MLVNYICEACNGSGEGRNEGSTCYKCGGSGEEVVEEPDTEAGAQEGDDDI